MPYLALFSWSKVSLVHSTIYRQWMCWMFNSRGGAKWVALPLVNAFSSLLFKKETSFPYVAYDFLFQESVEIYFPSADVSSENLQRCSQLRADRDSLISDWVIPSSLIISYWLTLECCENKMLISKLSVDLCNFLIAEWETNSKCN